MTNLDSSNSDPIPAAQEWALVLTAHESWLKQVIRARTGEPQSVDDIFQQLACVACSRGDSLRGIVNLVPWFHRVAVILSARHRRTMARVKNNIQRAADVAAQRPTITGIELLIHVERHQHTRQCFELLEPRDREILILKYEERMTYRSIAERLGITEKAVDRRLSRARQRLRSELQNIGMHENHH